VSKLITKSFTFALAYQVSKIFILCYNLYMSARYDAAVALSGEFSANLSDIGLATQQRMNTAIDIVETEDVPLVVSGNYPFRWRTAPPKPLAHLMKNYAVERGVPSSMIIVQDDSLDTIGDAVFTKIKVTEPRNWRRLAVVTSDAHVLRSQHIFNHVMGPEYQIGVIGAGTAEEIRFQRLQEFIGNTLAQAVLANTKPGDTAAIEDRLFTIIPGYRETPLSSRLLAFTAGLAA
jgi:uncharacterized SAM-binding protein YcdF (DUF218 family)